MTPPARCEGKASKNGRGQGKAKVVGFGVRDVWNLFIM
jgi:hypothetical protein